VTLVFCAPVWSEVAAPVALWLDAPCDVGVCGTEVSLDPADVVSVGGVASGGAVVGADWSLEELEAFEPLD
jgi:hypothetical protein